VKYRIEKKSACRIRLLSLGAALSVFGMGLFLTSCNDFYSTTWGDAFTRDPANVKVTSSNVNELLKDANGDTGASRAILEKLKETKDPKLQAAAVKAANQAAGLTGLALSNLGTITGDNAGNLDSLETLAKTILADAKENDIKGVAADIASTLPVTPDNTPLFVGNFADSVSTSDLTLLLVTMMLAEIPADMNDFDEYAAKWGSEKRIDDKGTIRLSKTERVIAAIANTVSERPSSELGKMLKNLVGMEN
jgi:hypothetical protein